MVRRRPSPRRRRRRARRGAPHFPLVCAGLALLLLVCLLARPGPNPRRDPDELKAILAALPEDLSPLRRAFVTQSVDLVGRVDYFWGGKPEHPGWDRRWGRAARVTSPGCEDTGRRMPYGLDCSGLVSWAAVTAAGDMDAYAAVGDGVREQYALCAPICWEDAQPGDLLFFPDLSHVGIVVGEGADGALLAVHSSRSLGGVVLSHDAQETGFTLAGRPALFGASLPSKAPHPAGCGAFPCAFSTKCIPDFL